MLPFSSLALLFPIVQRHRVIVEPVTHTTEFDYRVTVPQRLRVGAGYMQTVNVFGEMRGESNGGIGEGQARAFVRRA